MLGLYSRGGNAYLLGFVGLVPWLLALDATRTVTGAARSGLAMSFAFVAAVFAWFGFSVAGYLGIPEATGLLVLLAAAPLLQPQLLAFALFRHIAGRHHGPVVRALAGAAAWVATEWLVPRLFDDTLGHGLHPSYELRQIADVGGAPGITVLLILINEAIAAAIARRGEGARALLRPLAIAASVLVLMAGYGAVRLSMLTSASDADGTPLRVGMVQSNIVDYERLRREMGAYEVVRHVLDTHYAMSREAIDRHRVDALLWSETVYPTTYGHPKSEGGAELDREIQDFVSSAGVPLVFGTYDLDAVGEYNAAAFLEPSKTAPLGFYRKTDLFPLTEYVPRWLEGPTIRRWLPWAGTWKPGSGARVFPLRLSGGREIPVLPMICLDDTDAGLAIEGARLGAQVILGMSNDSWFTEHTEGANLHLAVAAFRSIETRLPQLRVTSNGVSAVIDATGTIVSATAMGEQKLLIGEVSIRQPAATLMVAWGDWVGRTAFVLLLLQALFWVGKALKRTKHSASPSPIATTAHAAFRAEAIVLAPVWRIAAGLLRVFAFGSLFWMGAALLFQSEQMNPLAQMRMFAALFLAPLAAAWCIARAFAATARIEGDALVLEQRERRTEIPIQHIAAVEPWTLALPSTGVWLRMESGRRWSRGLSLDDPAALVDALIRAGAPAAVAEASTGRALAYARTRLAVARHRLLDHPLVKFVLFPLVPALPAFRLHQHIAFGGTFGEYHTYGLQAYLTALGIWWASWAIGLVIFAALLRVIIEAGTWLSLVVRRESAIGIRRTLEVSARIVFYVGVPAWLLIRFWPWSPG
ncbi:MAG: apolipoprotein N-acyltransferase [Lysobacteraceae bacterium]